MAEEFSLQSFLTRVPGIDTMPTSGHVIRTIGLLVESAGPRARVGEICEVLNDEGGEPLPVQVVGYREKTLLSVPLGDTAGIRPGARVARHLLGTGAAAGTAMEEAMSEAPIPNVTVVGTGFGGLEAAFYLRKRLGKRVQITVVGENDMVDLVGSAVPDWTTTLAVGMVTPATTAVMV